MTDVMTVRERIIKASEHYAAIAELLTPILPMSTIFVPGTDWWEIVAGFRHVAFANSSVLKRMSEEMTDEGLYKSKDKTNK